MDFLVETKLTKSYPSLLYIRSIDCEVRFVIYLYATVPKKDPEVGVCGAGAGEAAPRGAEQER